MQIQYIDNVTSIKSAIEKDLLLKMTQKGKLVINNKEKTTTMASNNNLSPTTCMQRLDRVLTLLNRLLIGFVTFYICWISLKAEVILWHALFCTLGYVCFMSEGLMAHYRGNAWTQLCHRTEKTRTHWLLQLIGSLLGLLGIAIKMYLLDEHFQSIHAISGFAVLICCFISLASGLCSLYAHKLESYLQPLANKVIHCVIGMLTFILAFVCMYYAFETDIFVEYSLHAANFVQFHLFLQIVIIAIAVLSIYGPLWDLIYSKLWRYY